MMMKEMIDIKNSQKWKVLQGIWVKSTPGYLDKKYSRVFG